MIAHDKWMRFVLQTISLQKKQEAWSQRRSSSSDYIMAGITRLPSWCDHSCKKIERSIVVQKIIGYKADLRNASVALLLPTQWLFSSTEFVLVTFLHHHSESVDWLLRRPTEAKDILSKGPFRPHPIENVRKKANRQNEPLHWSSPHPSSSFHRKRFPTGRGCGLRALP